ncbi:DDI1-like DNA-damage inducible protein [Giardia lamblia P15]|uniref:DDI1-like DNA-damage inducible protein n=1 Tax=Giardia intestinalis (strain P15) TaxID=658858 RepID=E1F1U7_GIAIA|nr:DDI1-like DNA-damage inducible protein [Giardia lamblia P15]
MPTVTIVYGHKLSTAMDIVPDETVLQLIERFMKMCSMPGHAINAIIRINGQTLTHDSKCSSIQPDSTLIYMNPSATFSAVIQKTLARGHANLPAVQRLIDEDVKQVYDHYPELLVNNTNSVYIHIELNGHQDIAVIDTGAEFSTISLDTAIRCGLEDHIDKRQEGRALGVGSSRIVGKIHLVQLKYGEEYFATNFMVVESVVGTLLGMPFLRMHRMVIDLAIYQIRIGDVSLPIMSDAEVEAYKADMMNKVDAGAHM